MLTYIETTVHEVDRWCQVWRDYYSRERENVLKRPARRIFSGVPSRRPIEVCGENPEARPP